MKTARWLKSATKSILWLLVLAAIALAIWGYIRQNPQDIPWTKFDISDPVGRFTSSKLAALGDKTAECKVQLDKAGVEYTALAPQGSDACYAENLLKPGIGGAITIDYSPADVAPSCPVVAALALWEWRVLQPAAQRHFGSKVVRIGHYGSYSCRRMYGREDGRWSEHATGNAIDISSFELADGRTVNIRQDWTTAGEKANFLREVRDGACDLFSSVLSPDYNDAHADHFHLDQTIRSGTGWSVCR